MPARVQAAAPASDVVVAEAAGDGANKRSRNVAIQ